MDSTPKTLFRGVAKNKEIITGSKLTAASSHHNEVNPSNGKDAMKGYVGSVTNEPPPKDTKATMKSFVNSASPPPVGVYNPSPIFPSKQRHLGAHQQNVSNSKINQEYSNPAPVLSQGTAAGRSLSAKTRNTNTRSWFEFYLILLNIFLSTAILLTIVLIAYLAMKDSNNEFNLEDLTLKAQDGLVHMISSFVLYCQDLYDKIVLLLQSK